jgi:predicted RNase H-like nuclease
VSTLLVGFDSAWTARNTGGLVGVLHDDDGRCRELGLDDAIDFEAAAERIESWRESCRPKRTLILIDQPTIVRNATRQRPVEHLAASPVSRRRGGVQPAKTGRAGMFDAEAPVWTFLSRFGGALDPLDCGSADPMIVETYPVLTLIALGWLREDSRSCGRLPKYNPERQNIRPRKADQDGLDACLCLLTAIHLAANRPCLRVGNTESGLIIVPDSAALRDELDLRCKKTGRIAADWVREIRYCVEPNLSRQSVADCHTHVGAEYRLS